MAASNRPIPIRLTLCLSEKAAQRLARDADLGEDRFLLLRAAQATEFGDELAHRPVLPEKAVARDMG